MRLAWAAGALVLALVAVWVLVPATDPGAAIEGRDDDLGTTTHTERAPVLQANPAARKPQVAGDEEDAGPKEPQGPYRFFVVSRATEAPLADVEITTDDGVRLGQTHADGRLEFEWPDESSFVFRAAKEGFVPHRGLATTRREVEVALQPGITIKGRVVRYDSEEPVKDAVVHTFDEDLEFEIAAPVTNEAGRFEITGVRPNHPLTLIVCVPGITPLVRHENFERATDDLEIVVGEGAQLDVLVLDPKAHPVPNVEVQLLPPGVPPGVHRGAWEGPGTETLEMLDTRTAVLRTDEDGRCRFHAVPLKTPYEPLVLATDRWFARGRPVYFLKPDQTAEVTIRLTKTADLEVRVEDERGEPVGGVDLELRSGRLSFPIHPKDRSGTGTWTFRGISPGSYGVRASRPGAPSAGAKADVRSAHIEKVRVEMPRGRALLGRVEDKRGEAIWLAEISWTADDRSESASTKTDTKGRFRLDGLTKEKGILRVRAVDLPTTRFSYEGVALEDVGPGGGRMRIVLRDGTRVKGEIRDLPKGTAVYMRMIPGTKRDYGRLRLDKESRFERRGPQAESRASFVFWTKGFPPILHREVRRFGSEEVRDIGIFSFQGRNPFKGRVVGARKEPLRGIKVEVAEPWSAQYVRTDAQGDFEFRNMPYRDVRVRLSGRGYAERVFVLTPKSEYVRQTFQFEPAGRVRLFLRDAWHRKAGGVRARFVEVPRKGQRSKPINVTRKTNAQGALVVTLPPGMYQMHILHAPRRTMEQWALETFHVAAATMETISVQLKTGKRPKGLLPR